MPSNSDTPIELPPPVAAYFAADVGDAHRVARCFTENAVVIDGREHRGRLAIARWKAHATAKYHYTSEPLNVELFGEDVVVVARLTGDFPGSPVELRYHFAIHGDKLARLEIT